MTTIAPIPGMWKQELPWKRACYKRHWHVTMDARVPNCPIFGLQCSLLLSKMNAVLMQSCGGQTAAVFTSSSMHSARRKEKDDLVSEVN